ncbi:MAG TPA: exodeoxyribonuclease V subunit alpha [Gammaproteobacteria bacterium]|nr:exodeoxyribonuclease V subunit alpha [Gammaproteobacteria bacterium]
MMLSLRKAEPLASLDWVCDADRHLAKYVVGLDPDAPDFLALLVALTSALIRQGHVCLSLSNNPLLESLGIQVDPAELEQVVVVGKPGATDVPLILDGDRFYLARYHVWEQQVIKAVMSLLHGPHPHVDEEKLKQGLAENFPLEKNKQDTANTNNAINWQQIAAALAVTRRFCVISGGPGTGKTWTVARIVKLLLDQQGEQPLRIAMAAPTGKAAARMTESMRKSQPELMAKVGEAKTLHRLLGMREGRIQAKHGPDNPLPLDLLIVDEVSMVGLPMMARLVSALPSDARLILLGDRHQLASVDAGQVMAGLCGDGGGGFSENTAAMVKRLTGHAVPVSGGTQPSIADHVVVLQESRRFDPGKGIGRLADAVNRGDENGVVELLKADDPQVAWHETHPSQVKALLKKHVIPVFKHLREEGVDPHAALKALDKVRVLCALRHGPQGVHHINAQVTAMLGEEDGTLYHGRPVMVLVNDYEQKLFNGDIGLILSNANGRLRAYFPGSENEVREFLPSRLPQHETVYAMTIHKSQGSEFEKVLLLLPAELSPVVTRELVYTGITRARSKVMICATEASITDAVKQQVNRSSGLYHYLWGQEG